MSEGPDDAFPFGSVPASSTHPTNGPSRVLEDRERVNMSTVYNMADLARMIQPGDQVLWHSRKQPLDVVERDYSREQRYTTGERELAWIVEGNRGGRYLLSLWWHWGEEGDGYEDCTGLYPQTHRITDGVFDTSNHFEALAVDGPIAEGSARDLQAEDPTRIVYEIDGQPHRYAGRVDRWEFGEPVVEPIGSRPLVDAEHTVDPDDVIAWRWRQ